MNINNPETKSKNNFFLFIAIFLISLNLDNKKLVKNNITVVQMHLCMRTSICPINDICLKYITPINPHQTEPKLENKIPLLKSLLDAIIN